MNIKTITALVVEDEEAIRDMLQFSLERNHFKVINAENTEQAMHALNNIIPDVIILDWMLPGKNGVDFIKWIRNDDVLHHIPIIMLTAKAEEENKIIGLTTGADDYITKPFSINELMARIKTVLRRGILVSPAHEIKFNQLVLNTEKKEILIEQKPIKLLPAEFKLLHFFIQHPNKTYTRDQLINYIYGRNMYVADRTIDVQIKRLREKLRPYKYDQFIKTVRGIGYYFLWEKNDKRY